MSETCNHGTSFCRHTQPSKFELKIARVLCDAQGDYDWKYLKDIKGNPSTAYAYFDLIEMAQKVIKKLGLSDVA
jgi:hypothetical protein